MNRRNFIRMVVGGTAAVACGVTVAKEESTLTRSIRENIEKRHLPMIKQWPAVSKQLDAVVREMAPKS